MKLVISLCVLLVASVTARPQGIIDPSYLDGGIVHPIGLNGLDTIMSKRQIQSIIAPINTGFYPNWITELGTIMSKRQSITSPIYSGPFANLLTNNYWTILSKRQVKQYTFKDNTLSSLNRRQTASPPCPANINTITELEGAILQAQGYNVTCGYSNYLGRVFCHCPGEGIHF